MDSRDFLGRGWSFPIAVDPRTGRIAMVSHEEDIRQSVGLILRTYRGERVMRPSFGSRAADYVFESDAQDFALSVSSELEGALTRCEPRIRDVKVAARMEGKDHTTAVVEISYTVRSTNNYFNLVYPFHLLERVEA